MGRCKGGRGWYPKSESDSTKKRNYPIANYKPKRELSISEELELLLEKGKAVLPIKVKTLLKEQDQQLPAEIRKLSEKKPEKALCILKILEEKAKGIIEELEVKAENFERVKEYLNYFENCGIYSNELKRNIKEKTKSIIKGYRIFNEEINTLF